MALFSRSLWLGWTLGVVSCAAPKAVVVEEEPVKPVAKVEAPVEDVPGVPVLPNDGLRLPGNLLELPGEGEMKATNPALPQTPVGPGALTARPPVEPVEKPESVGVPVVPEGPVVADEPKD